MAAVDEADLLAGAERARTRDYVQHTLYRRTVRGDPPLPALTLTRRYAPVLTTADVYAARPGAGDVEDMQAYRKKKALEAAEAAGEGEDGIGTAATSALEARARYGGRNMAETRPTELHAVGAAGWKRYAERQLRDAIRTAPLVIEHATVLLVVERWLSPTDQQVIWDLGNGVTLHQAALHGHVGADAVKKARATALNHLLEFLHEAAEKAPGDGTGLRRAG